MKKYPSGSVEMYNMIDEAKVFLSDCFKENKQYVNVETMSYEEMICRLYIECCNCHEKVENMERKVEYANENVERANNAVKTIDEAFQIAKSKIMEYYFAEMRKQEADKLGNAVSKYSQDYIAGYATAVGDFSKFLKSGE